MRQEKKGGDAKGRKRSRLHQSEASGTFFKKKKNSNNNNNFYSQRSQLRNTLLNAPVNTALILFDAHCGVCLMNYFDSGCDF